ncbi:MAG: M48 family metalloprotease [Candidatus Babeliales bacterium]
MAVNGGHMFRYTIFLQAAFCASLLHAHEQSLIDIRNSVARVYQRHKNVISNAIEKASHKKTYGSLSPRNQQFIYAILREVNLHEKISIKSHFTSCHGMIFGSILIINEKLFNELSDQEKRFVIAHEIMHYLLNHVGYKLCYASFYNANDDEYNTFSRLLEKEADLAAVQQFSCLEGGILFFKRLKHTWGCSYYDKKNPQLQCIYDPEHPTFQERITYLEALRTPQPRTLLSYIPFFNRYTTAH